MAELAVERDHLLAGDHHARLDRADLPAARVVEQLIGGREPGDLLVPAKPQAGTDVQARITRTKTIE